MSSKSKAKVNTKNIELQLKDHVSDIVYDCLQKFYRTGRLGYLTMIGGEAINHYLPAHQKLKTGDFDIKFVVNPDFIDSEKDLIRANSLRMRLTDSLYKCLQSISKNLPKGFTHLYPKLGIPIKQIFHPIYLDDGRMFFIDPKTGSEQYVRYQTNKTFKIKLYYSQSLTSQDHHQHQSFDLMDIGLFYRKNLAFSFFEDGIYDTFLHPPFNKKTPIPYNIHPKLEVRIPTLQFLLFDNFRMILISLDNMAMIPKKEDPSNKDPNITFWAEKLKKYNQKVDIMLDVFIQSNPKINAPLVDKFREALTKTVKLYEPLSFLNMLCLKEKALYIKKDISSSDTESESESSIGSIPDDILTRKKSQHPECNTDYAKRLAEFEKAYYEVAEITNRLRRR